MVRVRVRSRVQSTDQEGKTGTITLALLRECVTPMSSSADFQSWAVLSEHLASCIW